MRVLGISGSLRRDSYNSGLLRAAADLLPSGAELEVFEDLKAIPPFDADDDIEPAPYAVAALRDAIAGADAVLVERRDRLQPVELDQLGPLGQQLGRCPQETGVVGAGPKAPG